MGKLGSMFIYSDPHFGHDNTWKLFKRQDGSPLRPFTSSEEMNETIIKNHNDMVHPYDKVYMLGDIVINKRFLPIIKRLNGHLRLVRGNHDIFSTDLYLQAGFDEIYGVRVFDDMILSHVPLHPDCVTKRFNVNVHGHEHCNYFDDPRYLCVSVEQTNYGPLPIETVRARIKKHKEDCEANGWTGKLILG